VCIRPFDILSDDIVPDDILSDFVVSDDFIVSDFVESVVPCPGLGVLADGEPVVPDVAPPVLCANAVVATIAAAAVRVSALFHVVIGILLWLC
jgi:hypothetical protein